jgi:hypothetical protein
MYDCCSEVKLTAHGRSGRLSVQNAKNYTITLRSAKRPKADLLKANLFFAF